MHRVVSFVFKTIGISIIAMIVLDAILMVSDAYITNSRIQAQASIMEQELAKNNYISEKADEVFRGSDPDNPSGLTQIVNMSNVYTSLDYNYEELDEDHIGQYGEMKTLKIHATMNPWVYTFSGKANSDGIQKVETDVSLTYTFVVPCLRYLK